MTLVTKTELHVGDYIQGYADIVIPKGTRTTHMTACGIDENYNFIADLSWIPKELGILRHDMIYHSIHIDRKLLEEV